MKRDPARAGDPGQRVIRALVNLGPEADAGLVFPRAKRMHENQEAFTMGPKSKCSGPVARTSMLSHSDPVNVDVLKRW